MEHISHIEALEARARELGLSPTALYARAGVPKATLSRWRRGLNSPSLVAFHTTMGKLKAVLDEEASFQAKVPA
jgi:predicted transcriptional regulator